MDRIYVLLTIFNFEENINILNINLTVSRDGQNCRRLTVGRDHHRYQTVLLSMTMKLEQSLNAGVGQAIVVRRYDTLRLLYLRLSREYHFSAALS